MLSIINFAIHRALWITKCDKTLNFWEKRKVLVFNSLLERSQRFFSALLIHARVTGALYKFALYCKKRSYPEPLGK